MRSAGFCLGGLVTVLAAIGCSGGGGDDNASSSTGGAGSSAGSSTGAGGSGSAGASAGGHGGSGTVAGSGNSTSAGASQGGTASSTAGAGGSGSAGDSQGGSASQGGSTSTGGAGGTMSSAGAGGSGGHGGTLSSAGAGGAGGHGGTTSTGGHGGMSSTGGAGGMPAQGGSSGTDPFCSTPMPTGGTPKSGTDFGGTADGLAYSLWTNGKGGTITVFDNAHAFSANWDKSANFLANIGLNFGTGKKYTEYGKILAQFLETKSGTDGNYSFIGIYGWTQNPCTEWYIVEDSYEAMPIKKGALTATIDGGTYYMSTNQTTGSGGNACEAGHTGPWTQFWNVRSAARHCGTVTVSDHFDAWTKQGWSLGNLHYVHISLEVLGGTGEIDFPVANVTTGG